MQPLQPSNVLQYYTSGHANTKFAAWPFCLTVCYSSLLRGKILPAMLGNQTRIICLVLYPKLVSCPGSMMLDHWIPVEPALVMRNLQFFFSNSSNTISLQSSAHTLCLSCSGMSRSHRCVTDQHFAYLRRSRNMHRGTGREESLYRPSNLPSESGDSSKNSAVQHTRERDNSIPKTSESMLSVENCLHVSHEESATTCRFGTSRFRALDFLACIPPMVSVNTVLCLYTTNEIDWNCMRQSWSWTAVWMRALYWRIFQQVTSKWTT